MYFNFWIECRPVLSTNIWRKSSEGTFYRHAQSETLAVKELQKEHCSYYQKTEKKFVLAVPIEV